MECDSLLVAEQKSCVKQQEKYRLLRMEGQSVFLAEGITPVFGLISQNLLPGKLDSFCWQQLY
jgi:hypothetical protein